MENQWLNILDKYTQIFPLLFRASVECSCHLPVSIANASIHRWIVDRYKRFPADYGRGLTTKLLYWHTVRAFFFTESNPHSRTLLFYMWACSYMGISTKIVQFVCVVTGRCLTPIILSNNTNDNRYLYTVIFK